MAFNTDTEALQNGAVQMQNIAQDVLNGLARYMSTNQDLTGPGFDGLAAMASLRTTEDISTTGKQVSARFQACIDMMKSSAHQYAQMNEDNRTALSHVNVQNT